MLRRVARASSIGVLLSCIAACASSGGAANGLAAEARRNPIVEGRIMLGGGDYEHDTEGSIHDDTGAGFFSMLVEGGSRQGIGGGMSIESTSSDDDLFEDSGTPAQASVAEVVPYFLWRAVNSTHFRMPLRAGLWLHVLELDDQSNDDTFTWVSAGLRLALDPEFVIVARPGFELSLHSSLALAAGSTVIEVDSAGSDEEFESDAVAASLEFGPRARWSHFFAGVSFVHREFSADESDPEGGLVIRAIDADYDGVALVFGGGW